MNRCWFDWRSLVFTVGILSVLNLSCSSQDDALPTQAEAQVEKKTVKKSVESDVLEQDVATLKEKAADQAHAMMDVDYHFTNLWFAGKAENWPLADFYWSETRSHMRWALRIIPVRKDNAGIEIKLKDILEAVENSPLTQLKEAIDAKDSEKFESAYRFTVESCYACHKASDKPYLRPQIPERPASSIINFDPNAKWPK
jgi:hypothetical protein